MRALEITRPQKMMAMRLTIEEHVTPNFADGIPILSSKSQLLKTAA
jgi:hypothetical protein